MSSKLNGLGSTNVRSSLGEDTNPLSLYASFPFNSNEGYQQGLTSIVADGALDGSSSGDAREDILRRTRVFYFNRVTGNSITVDEAREYECTLSNPPLSFPVSPVVAPQTETNNDEQPRLLSFAEVIELVQSGRTDEIPNMKEIPDVLNASTPSESVAPVRKKPWEVADLNKGSS